MTMQVSSESSKNTTLLGMWEEVEKRQVNLDKPSKIEIFKTITHLRQGKATGPDTTLAKESELRKIDKGK